MNCTRSLSALPFPVYLRYKTLYRFAPLNRHQIPPRKFRVLYSKKDPEIQTQNENALLQGTILELPESISAPCPWWKPFLQGLTTVSLLALICFLRPVTALAAKSGGRMGGSNFSSSYRSTPSTSSTNWSRSSFSSSPIRGSPVQVNTFLFPSYGFGFGGGSSLFTLLFYAFAAYTLFTVIRSFTQQDWADRGDYYDEEESVSERASVCKVQVGLLGLARNLQRDLDSLARRADTSSPEGLQYLLQETLLALNRNPDYCVYGASEVKRARNIERAETGFNAISMKERGKIKEETLSNWEGRRKETQTTIAKSQIGNELIVVTILVASVGTLQLPTVRSKDDLRTALNRLGAIRSRDLLALEVLWTPQDENDSYTPDELVADYPELCSL